jgi:protein kinase C substrate 80K-H
MAVKAAVVGYTEKYVKPVEAEETAEQALEEPSEEETPEVLVSEKDLDDLEKMDLDALLMSGDIGGEADATGEEDEHEGTRKWSYGMFT